MDELLNVRDENDQTRLHKAVECANPLVVHALLRCDADTAVCNDWGWTPCHLACLPPRREIDNEQEILKIMVQHLDANMLLRMTAARQNGLHKAVLHILQQRDVWLKLNLLRDIVLLAGVLDITTLLNKRMANH